MSNAIEQIAKRMLYLWEDAASHPVKLVRIIVEREDESMLEAFYDYMLTMEAEQEDLVFLLELPFNSIDTFSAELLAYVYEEIKCWNMAEKPKEIPFSSITWQPDYGTANSENRAQLAVENLNLLTQNLLADSEIKCNFIFHITNEFNKKEFYKWLREALQLPFDAKMVWGVSDLKGNEIFKALEKDFPTETISISPPINLGRAMENLAEQAAAIDNDDAGAEFRVRLVKLMNSVKNRDESLTQVYGKQCIGIAAEKVATDANWLSQVVTVYTILYTDKIGYRQYEDALYFADKAIEASRLSEGRVDPSMSYRLIGHSLMGKGGIQTTLKKWTQATENYQEASEAYARCNDYLMQCDALRMCGWCMQKQGEEEAAVNYYIEAYNLVEKLGKDLVENSTFPLVVKQLLNNPYRLKKISDEDMDKTLSSVLGADWRTYIQMYGKVINKYDE